MLFCQGIDVEYPVFNRSPYAVDQDKRRSTIPQGPKTRIDLTDLNVLVLWCLC